MANQTDAAELGALAMRLGLITEDHLRECLDDLGPLATAQTLVAALERKGHLTAYQGQKLLKGDTEGYTLGGYRKLYKIASGSFGRVFRGEDPRTGIPVAIKELRRRWCDDPHKIDLFEREGKVGLSLRHPNIVQIMDVFCDRARGQYGIVMEFVEGSNLRELLAIRKKLEPKEALRIIDECAAGLAYAYSRGLTHRDMKPSNILLSSHGGAAKLVDFGLAEIAEGVSLADDETTFVDRTVDYAGLEKATNVKAGDVRSDIFFLGCVLYEILSGKPALLPIKDRRARMHKQRFERIIPLSRSEVDGPASLFQLVERMIALDPQMRFQTPSQLIDAIHMVQAELGGGPSVEALTPEGPRTVFIIEKNPKFQDALRDKFKALGLRVLISIDPIRALKRYQEQYYHLLVVDVATSGEDGLDVYRDVQKEATKKGSTCAGILLLADERDRFRFDIPDDRHTKVLTFPLKKGELESAMAGLLPGS
jgi:serine/threonine protein kinase